MYGLSTDGLVNRRCVSRRRVSVFRMSGFVVSHALERGELGRNSFFSRLRLASEHLGSVLLLRSLP
jgi:hypothetical protein